jgi:hypothetical protein
LVEPIGDLFENLGFSAMLDLGVGRASGGSYDTNQKEHSGDLQEKSAWPDIFPWIEIVSIFLALSWAIRRLAGSF